MYKCDGLSGPVVTQASNNKEKEIDMKDYRKMSDFEINNEVAMLWLKDYGYEYYQHGTCDGVEVYSECGFVDRYDYCNNPSDAWPIIIDNSITFNYDTAKVHVGSYFSDTAKVSENRNKALRAAMIVYLMMKDAEK
ncbi:MAG: phage protein NinX family protein [Aeromonadaceae bacterium]